MVQICLHYYEDFFIVRGTFYLKAQGSYFVLICVKISKKVILHVVENVECIGSLLVCVWSSSSKMWASVLGKSSFPAWKVKVDLARCCSNLRDAKAVDVC